MSAMSAAAGSVRSWVDLYLTAMRVSIATGFQYRVANYLYLVGAITEPVIYLVVWSTVAEQQGGSVGGITPAGFAAYFIVWTLVRNMNIALTPWAWEERIRQGELSAMLLRPLHPFHYDLGFLAGWKVVVIVMWLPIAAVLSLLFRPEFDFGPIEVLAFGISIWGAYVLRSLFLWLLGLVTFWTTRVGPFFQIFFTLELLLSGRLVPLSLLPTWAQDLADVLPFKWTFGFPIETLVGDLTPVELAIGLASQFLWIGATALVVRFAWRIAVRRFSSVGG